MLAAGAAALLQDPLQPVQRVLVAELARERPTRVERRARDVPERPQRAVVEDRGVGAVTRGAEADQSSASLGRAGGRRRLRPPRGRARGRAPRAPRRLERGLGVHLAHLDGPVARVEPDVPPEERRARAIAGGGERRRDHRPRARRDRAAGAGRRGPGRRATSAKRALARPESAPNHHGLVALRPCSSGSCSRSALKAARARVSSGMPTWTWSADSGVRRSSPRISSATRS